MIIQIFSRLTLFDTSGTEPYAEPYFSVLGKEAPRLPPVSAHCKVM